MHWKQLFYYDKHSVGEDVWLTSQVLFQEQILRPTWLTRTLHPHRCGICKPEDLLCSCTARVDPRPSALPCTYSECFFLLHIRKSCDPEPCGKNCVPVQISFAGSRICSTGRLSGASMAAPKAPMALNAGACCGPASPVPAQAPSAPGGPASQAPLWRAVGAGALSPPRASEAAAPRRRP